jgi:adenylyltransferase/sulfurtransferase
VSSPDDRYARQARAFPEERRTRTALISLGGAASPFAARALAMGAAAMGIPALFFDYHGEGTTEGHWLRAPHPHLVRAVDPQVAYHFLDPVVPGEDLACLLPPVDNGWLVGFVHDGYAVSIALRSVRERGIDLPVLLAADGPGGVLVLRFSGVAAAQEQLGFLPDPRRQERIAPGDPEFGLLAAGLVLNEVMVGNDLPEGDRHFRTPVIGYYSLHNPRRTEGDPYDRHLWDLLAELARPAGRRASFAGLRVLAVGAGALANWGLQPVALQSPGRLTVFDGDPAVERSNLNRQPLLCRREGERKAPALAEELRGFDPAGTYEAVPRFVEAPGDLAGLEDSHVVLCFPDNDACRLLCTEAARTAGVVCATAGSSGLGAQAVTVRPDGPCYRCVSGLQGTSGEDAAARTAGAEGCARVAADAVVGANLVGAGIAVSEVREYLSGRRTANVRFDSRGAIGNRLRRSLTDPPCSHRPVEKTHETGCRV